MIDTILYASIFILIALAFVFMIIAEHKRNMEHIEFEERIQRMRHQFEKHYNEKGDDNDADKV